MAKKCVSFGIVRRGAGESWEGPFKVSIGKPAWVNVSKEDVNHGIEIRVEVVSGNGRKKRTILPWTKASKITNIGVVTLPKMYVYMRWAGKLPNGHGEICWEL